MAGLAKGGGRIAIAQLLWRQPDEFEKLNRVAHGLCQLALPARELRRLAGKGFCRYHSPPDLKVPSASISGGI
jgi:hypothetical protein